MTRPPPDEALLAVARLVMDVSVRAATDLGGLSSVQLRALTVLDSSGVTNLASLAEDIGVTVSTASRLVDRLVAAGWVHRGPAPHTRREVSLTLTDAGTALLSRFDDRRLAVLRGRLDRVPSERRAAVAEALGELAGPTATPGTPVGAGGRRRRQALGSSAGSGKS
jgi:DNA-binding MarR family transcriptional regulator